MRVCVLGCGPAGLIAAHAALSIPDLEVEVHVMSRVEKSRMPGAQYLHERIPGVSPYEPDGYLCYRKMGTPEGYARKVYGSPDHSVSWSKFEEGFYPAWSLSDTYDLLWRAWASAVVDVDIDPSFVRATLVPAYDLIVSSIPAPVLCDSRCQFQSQPVWFTNNCWNGCEENEIVYNGEEGVPWYRSSNIFGHTSTEYAARPMADVRQTGFKPTENNCTCTPENVLRVGRFGKWDKNALVHHAYKETQDAVLALQ